MFYIFIWNVYTVKLCSKIKWILILIGTYIFNISAVVDNLYKTLLVQNHSCEHNSGSPLWWNKIHILSSMCMRKIFPKQQETNLYLFLIEKHWGCILKLKAMKIPRTWCLKWSECYMYVLGKWRGNVYYTALSYGTAILIFISKKVTFIKLFI